MGDKDFGLAQSAPPMGACNAYYLPYLDERYASVKVINLYGHGIEYVTTGLRQSLETGVWFASCSK